VRRAVRSTGIRDGASARALRRDIRTDIRIGMRLGIGGGVRFTIGLAALLQFALGSASAESNPSSACERLQALSLQDTQIVAATAIDGRRVPWKIDNDTLTGREVPVAQAFCRVQGRIETEIQFELWLPAQSQWNGKHLGVGNGGYSGFINYSALAHGLRRGYAASSTDTGHTGGPADASWMLNRPDRIENYGHRGHHLTARISREIIAAYYGKPARHAYFMGCSNGGQQGLTAAQRYPEDYDGIISGAPGTNFPDMATYVMLSGVRNSGKASLTQQQMQWVVERMVNACDAQDGVVDGLIEHPPSCKFDFDSLACAKGQTGECLDRQQVQLLRDLYSPMEDDSGNAIYPPPALGALLPVSDLARRGKLGADLYRYAVFGDLQWDPSKFVLERDLPIARKRLSALISDQTDLSPFVKRGGKLIIYHGWDDSGPSPFNTIDYHTGVRERFGASKTDEFFRLFMAPGMYHCAGGPGPNNFGNVGDPPVLDAQHDVLMALENWVERGIAPDRLIASRVTNERVERTRPLCPYPQRARYRGQGDIDRAENFDCVAPTRR
jgi:feruloyl esterase